MKLQLLSVLLIVAGAYALPRANDVVIVAESSNELIQRNFVEDQIRNVIELISSVIRGVGLDPVEVEREEIEIIQEFLDFVLKAFVENFKFNGASDIRIHNLSYSHLFNRLRLDISLPEISLSIGDSGLLAQVEDFKFEGQFKGSLKIKSIRLVGEVYLNVGITGISVRSVEVDFSLGGIESALQLVIQDDDISENLNNILGERIPFFFEDNRDDINGFIENLLSDLLNRIWSI